MAESLRIFISHSHTDDNFGIKLAQDLRQMLGGEETVWYDASGGLHGGDTWWRKIVGEISSRPVFLVILSPDALGSRWVQDEINLAWRLKNAQGTRIIPLLYRPCDVWPDLQTLQIISCLAPKPYEFALGELALALGLPAPAGAQPYAMPGGAGHAAAAPPPPPAGAMPPGAGLGHMGYAAPPQRRPVLHEVLTPMFMSTLLQRKGVPPAQIQALIGTTLAGLPIGRQPGDVTGIMGKLYFFAKATKHADRTFPAPYPYVVAALVLALKAIGREIVALADSPEGCVIQVKLPYSLRAYTGSLLFQVVDMGNVTAVHGISQIKGQMVDWGKGNSALNGALDKTAEFL